MKINHRNTNLTRKKLIKGFRLYASIVLCFALFGSVTAFAAGDPLSTINNLSTFVFGLILRQGNPGSHYLMRPNDSGQAFSGLPEEVN